MQLLQSHYFHSWFWHILGFHRRSTFLIEPFSVHHRGLVNRNTGIENLYRSRSNISIDIANFKPGLKYSIEIDFFDRKALWGRLGLRCADLPGECVCTWCHTGRSPWQWWYACSSRCWPLQKRQFRPLQRNPLARECCQPTRRPPSKGKLIL